MKNLYLLFSAAMFIILSISASELSLLSADQNVMQQKCTKCHSIRIPDNYSKKEWKYNVERMAKRAGLTALEIQSIIDLNKK